MERQTLQQQTPVYHVCQQCNGAGCAVCADLCIVEGDLSPINRVIGVKPAWKPAYEFIVVWKEDGKPFNKCFTNESDCVAHFESLRGRATGLYMVYPDGRSVQAQAKPVCPLCSKADWDFSSGCLNAVQYSSCVGDWVCCK